MDVVVINSNNHNTYSDQGFADKYWEGMVGTTADNWSAAATPKKLAALVNATLLIDNETYIDAANTQALRYGITDANARQLFRLACADLAGQLLIDDTLNDKSTSGSNVERIDAGGGTAVRFFSPTLGETGRFPVRVQRLIGAYLSGSSPTGIAGSYSTGTSSYGPDATPNVPFDENGDGYGTSKAN